MNEIRPPTPKELEECLAHHPQVIQTAAGPREYADRGQGPALLAVHGSPGGYDQGLGLGEFFRVNGFRTIAPSRPGYLGTPLATGRTPEVQADALAALLDSLQIEKIPVIATSGGGPSSYLLAARHPARVSCLMEINSLCQKYERHIPPLEKKLFLSQAGHWLVGFCLNHFPKPMVKYLLKTDGTLDRHEIAVMAEEILQDASKLAFLKFLMATIGERLAERQDGLQNDVAQMGALTQLDLGRISCPTLIMTGSADKRLPPRQGEYAQANIAGAELYWIRGGSHWGFWLAGEAYTAQDYALFWLRDKSRT
jgi:pimeloyl-ACP methyl ester carboxylesterase